MLFRSLIAGFVILASTHAARGQALNVTFGPSAPTSTYAAAGLPGVWNAIGGTGGTTYDLVGLDGLPTGVTLSQSGGDTLATTADPSIDGDDAALLNQALVTYVSGQESCLFINGLAPGSYEVLMYAWTPNAPTVRSHVRHDLSTVTVDVGGAWPGAHAEGVTYARHVLDIKSDGFMGSHSGIVPGAVAADGAVVNGFQIRLNQPGMDPPPGDPPVDPPAPTDAGGCNATRDTSSGMLACALVLIVAIRRRRA